VLHEIVDRIITVISETDTESGKEALEKVKECPDKVEFTRFYFIHYDVMGSGRFFYIDRMEDISFKLLR